MLTLHRAALVLPDPTAATAPSITDGAVLVDGAVVAAIGPYASVRTASARAEAARVRDWGGLLVPGLSNPHGRWLLEHAYHPDPREELGAEPLLPEGELDEVRRGGSARRGLQRMLAYGTTAVAGPFDLASVRTAVTRSGLRLFPGTGASVGSGTGTGEAGGPDPLASAGLAEAVHGPLQVGARADFAVFDAPSAAALERKGAECCLATVLSGRLVYRRR